jgi:NAD(P)-dependent dehydrogenase (short-subunit alcohol dehydrogenase family)
MSSVPGRFAGKVALVTGASRGIGFAVAERLVAEGARVCITARKTEALEVAVESLGGKEHAMLVAGKGDDVEHHSAAVAAAIDAYGRLDVLVNNTGINPAFGPMIEQELSAARKVFDVNVLGVVGWIKAAYDAWLGANGGAIVNIASIAGTAPAPGLGYYAASKAALIQMTQQLGFELAPKIRVNAVAPAVIKTQFARALYEGREEEAAAGYALGRLGLPHDVAGAVAFFASSDADWITGQTLVIDGGVSLMRGVG